MATQLATHCLTADDNSDAGWAAGEIAVLIRHIGPATAAGMVLRQAQRELQSLAAPAAEPSAPARVVGPFRVPRAA